MSLESWSRLLGLVGLRALTLTDEVTENDRSALFQLPQEVRFMIYAELLTGCEPAIFRLRHGSLYIRMHRTAAFAQLISTCRTIYRDAICLPLTDLSWHINHDGALHQSDYRRQLVDQNPAAAILAIPIKVVISMDLRGYHNFTPMLVGLREILLARQNNAHSSEVRLSLEEVADNAKSAVVKSLRSFLQGLQCCVVVYGYDQPTVNKEEDIEAASSELDNGYDELAHRMMVLRF